MGSQMVMEIDKSVADRMYKTMRKAKAEWDGRATIEANRNHNRSQRVIARAYAQVFGIILTDENDGEPGGVLTRAELSRIPTLRKEIRVLHPDAPSQSAFHPRRFIGPWLTWWNGLTWRSWLIGAVMATLFFTAFGIIETAKAAWWFVTLPVRHPHGFWMVVRVYSAFLFAGVLLYWVGRLCGPVKAKEEAPTTPMPVRSGVSDGRYGPYAIQDFREQNPFGDATLARKQEILRALQGQAGGFAPKFED
jgi:hypothetical protein